MKRDEYPPLLLRAFALLDLPLTLGVLGVGVFYIVMGNAGGAVIGAVLVVVAAWRLSLLVRAIAGR